MPADVSALGLDPARAEAVADALENVLTLGDSSPDDATVVAAYAALAASLAVLAQDIHDLRDSVAAHLDAAFLTASQIAGELPRRLFDHLLVDWLAERAEPVLQAALTLGVVEIREVARDPATFTSLHVRRTIRLDRLRTLITDPARLAREVYGWGTAQAELALLLERVGELGESIGLAVDLVFPPVEKDAALGPPGTVVDEGVATQPELQLTLLSAQVDGALAQLGLSLYPIPPETAGGPPGLALGIFGSGAFAEEIALDRYALWLLELRTTLDLRGGVMVLARPAQAMRLVVDPLGAATQLSGSVIAGVRRDADPGEEIVLLGTADGSGIRARGVHARAGVEMRGQQAVLLVELGADQGRASLSLAGSDSFIASVLPAELPDVAFDLAVAWSSKDGLSLRGGAGLELTTAASASLGPVRLQTISLSVLPGQQGVALAAGASVEVALGPLLARVDGAGVRFVVTAPGSGGNLGPLDFRPAFEPPSGVGLVVNSAAVKGGGYLFFDPDEEQYAGVMQLEFSGIALKAVGLLTTRLPGGVKGFSLLIIISAEFTPIQLGLGFTLNGVGGLFAVNRTVAVEPLRTGLKANALGSILFAQDPVRNAPQLIASLSAIFPPAAGRFVFGPMARIGWGTPTIITVDLALVLELPSPVRLLVLGRIRALLPNPEAPVLQLQMDVLGVIDFDRKEASVDATLIDSRLAAFALTGDMALRMSWGASPGFLLSVGGFNPRFLPPPAFPKLDRVAVALATGKNPRLRLEAYMALTSNTVQFGARLDLSVEAGPFTVAGFLAFDALVQFNPFAFVVDIAASLAVRAGGRTVLSVNLELTLSGPQPWRARGRASFKILFFEVGVHFDVTIGPESPPELPATVEIGPLLLAALRDSRSWSAQLATGAESLVTLRQLALTTEILAHPLGTLEVRQRVAPLERTLERFGTEVPAGTRQFRIDEVSIDGDEAETEPLEDLFAPAQFQALTDDQKLSLPSFEPMPSGVRIGERDVDHGAAVDINIVYEQRVVPALGIAAPPPAAVPLGRDGLAAVVGTSASEPTVSPGAFSVRAPGFVVASADDLSPVMPAEGAGATAFAGLLAEARLAGAVDAPLQLVERHLVALQ